MEERLNDILEFIDSYTKKNKFPPSQNDIAAEFPSSNGEPSALSLAQYWLKILKDRGLVSWVPGVGRTLHLTNKGRARIKK